jgi:acetylornithine/N-succinyldiaminopimelate aminotransferase
MSFLMDNYPPQPVTFVRGEGSRLWDVEGKAYLDFLGGLAVTSLGHAHPVVAEAIATQARTLLHVCNLFGTTIGPQVAETLDRLLGGGGKARPGGEPIGKARPGGEPIGKVFFSNSGAEANECAIKLARKWAGPGRYAVVSAYGSFHGRTLATLAATGQPTKHEPFHPMPEGFRHVALGDIDALDAAVDPRVVAAVLLEPIQGEGGVNVPPKGFLGEVRRLCDERDVLLMMDEVQTGLGRTGDWFAFQHEGIRPDVVTMAKALGNGMPIGACWARSEVAAAFVPGDHGTTFGGQPLAASAARATLAVMEAEDVPARAARAGARLTEGLAALPGVTSVRGRGLLLAAELAGRPSKDVAAAALARGLVVNAVTPTAIRLAPSLLVTDEELDEALSILKEVLA